MPFSTCILLKPVQSYPKNTDTDVRILGATRGMLRRDHLVILVIEYRLCVRKGHLSHIPDKIQA